MISALITWVIFGLVIIYLIIGLYTIPKAIYDVISQPNGSLSAKGLFGIIAVILVITIILCLLAFVISKNKYYTSFMDSVKMFALIAIPVFYIVFLIITLISKDQELLNLIFFKTSDKLSNFIELLMYYDGLTTYPVLISSLVFKFFAERQELKDYESEQKYIRAEKKKQEKIDNTNKEIEYYKKVSELDQLLKQETITQEKYNELKNSLDSQYNKNI